MANTSASTILTVGSFDGVHLGHQALLAEARATAARVVAPARVVVLAFDPSPRAILNPGSEPARLTGFAQRASLLREYGADEVVKMVPTMQLLGLEPEQFIADLCARFAPAAFVEGTNFRFGKGRRGDVAMLRAMGEDRGFAVQTVEPVEAAGFDQLVVTVSSTRIRALLAAGRVGDAAVLLARPYELSGVVVKGYQRGRTIGFPTANVKLYVTDICLPADGVYAAEVILQDGRVFGAALNIGTRPTVGGMDRTIEPYLIDAPREAGGGPAIAGLPEYGWPLTIRFVGYLREQLKFAGLEALRGQLLRDVEKARRLLAVGVVAGNL